MVALVGVLVVLVVLVVIPVVLLVWRSLTPGGSLSLDAYRAAFAGVSLVSLTATTVAFAAGSSLLGLALGTGLAVALVGTDLPGRRVLIVLTLAPLLLPGVLQTIAWIFLAAPNSGALSGIPALPSVFGLGGMIFVEGIRLAPLALLLVGAALRAGDPALEEAALMAGAGRAAVLRRVTLPLLRPALAATGLLLAIRALGSFEVPALLGIPDRTWVFTSRIWLSLDAGGDGHLRRRSGLGAAALPDRSRIARSGGAPAPAPRPRGGLESWLPAHPDRAPALAPSRARGRLGVCRRCCPPAAARARVDVDPAVPHPGHA